MDNPADRKPAGDHSAPNNHWAGKVFTKRILLLLLFVNVGLTLLIGSMAASSRRTLTEFVLACLVYGGIVDGLIVMMATLGSLGRPPVARPGSAFLRAAVRGVFGAIAGALVVGSIAFTIFRNLGDSGGWSGLVGLLYTFIATAVGAIVGMMVGVVWSLRREPSREKSSPAVHRDLDFR